MTEDDYILATTVARVYAIQDLLRRVHPRRGCITRAELDRVEIALDQWQSKLNNAISKARDAADA